MKDILQTLLGLPERKPRTAQVRMTEASEAAGQEIIFTIQELPYSRVQEITHLRDTKIIPAEIIVAGVKTPNLRDKNLLEHYHAPTPHELLPKIMNAGEIEELARRIETLSGYRHSVTELIDEVKKN